MPLLPCADSSDASHKTPKGRLTAYTETIVFERAPVVAVLALWIVAGRSATSLGLAAFGNLRFAVTSGVTALLVWLLLGQIRAARSMTSRRLVSCGVRLEPSRGSCRRLQVSDPSSSGCR
jgi:hypothetical protein